MIILGIVLIVLAALLPVPSIVGTLGGILVLVGVVLLVLDLTGNAIGGRRWY